MFKKQADGNPTTETVSYQSEKGGKKKKENYFCVSKTECGFSGASGGWKAVSRASMVHTK